VKYISDLTEAKGKLIISSHRRSGAHLFLQALRENRTRAGLPDGTIRHWMPNHPFLVRDCDDLSEVVNIVRDGRDVLVSCYYYYKKIERLKDIFQNVTFKDYLHGKVEVQRPDGILKQHWTEQMFFDPVGYWVDFVSSWLDVGILVKYETLLENFSHIPLLGRHKRKGIKGDYLNHFTEEDNNYFIKKAGNLMKKLGYDLGPTGDHMMEIKTNG